MDRTFDEPAGTGVTVAVEEERFEVAMPFDLAEDRFDGSLPQLVERPASFGVAFAEHSASDVEEFREPPPGPFCGVPLDKRSQDISSCRSRRDDREVIRRQFPSLPTALGADLIHSS